MVRVVGLGSQDPECKSHSSVELIPRGVDFACHPSEVGKNECHLAGILCRSGDPSRIVPNSQWDCWGSTNALQRVWSQWMDGCFHPFLSVCLLIAGILRISAIMLVGCVCHSVCLSVRLFVCVFVYPVAATPFQRSWPNWVQTSAMVQLRHLSFLVNLGQRSRSPKNRNSYFRNNIC